MNKVLLVGHVGSDSETRQNDGFSVTQLTIATDAGYFDKKKNEWIDGVDFHPIKTYSERDFKKGDLISVEGRLKEDRWKSTDGNDKSFRYVLASRINVLRRKNPQVNHDVTSNWINPKSEDVPPF